MEFSFSYAKYVGGLIDYFHTSSLYKILIEDVKPSWINIGVDINRTFNLTASNIHRSIKRGYDEV